jgi:hypothetical protein
MRQEGRFDCKIIPRDPTWPYVKMTYEYFRVKNICGKVQMPKLHSGIQKGTCAELCSGSGIMNSVVVSLFHLLVSLCLRRLSTVKEKIGIITIRHNPMMRARNLPKIV